MTRAQLFKRLKEIQIITESSFTLRSGEVSDYYCDMRKSYGYPDILEGIVELVKPLIAPSITCVAGLGYGGLPLATAVSLLTGLPLILVRDKPKAHGRGSVIEGYLPTKIDQILIIDDVISSGSSIRQTYELLKKGAGTVNSAIVIVERKKVTLPIPYTSVFTISELRS